jgi:UDPglucose 6-dehydrogenase
MARISVVGGGYVGLVTSVGLAELGHQVCCLEPDRTKLSLLRSGTMPIQEPQLTDLWNKHAASGRLSVRDDPGAALSLANYVFIAVGTPQSADGSAHLSYVDSAIRTVVEFSDMARVICVKSTVPPGTCARIQRDIRRKTGEQQGWTVVSNPEFLSQGRAVQDFLNPERIVVGSSSEVGQQGNHRNHRQRRLKTVSPGPMRGGQPDTPGMETAYS